MPKTFKVLLSLRPSIPVDQITESSIYGPVSQVAQIRNLKIVERGALVKAEIYVTSQEAVSLVIKRLNGKIIGIGKVEVSAPVVDPSIQTHYIKKAHTISEISGLSHSIEIESQTSSRQLLRVYGSGSHTGSNSTNQTSKPQQTPSKGIFTNSLQMTPVSRENSEDQSGSISGSKDISQSVDDVLKLIESGNAANIIKITHDDITALGNKKVLRIFRRFGRILNLAFDYERSHWWIEYRSNREAEKVTGAIERNDLYGYQVYKDEEEPDEKEEKVETVLDSETKQPQVFDENLVQQVEKVSSPSYLPVWAFLQVSYQEKKVPKDYLSKLIAATHLPLQLIQGFNPNTHLDVLRATFNFIFEAAEVLESLTALKDGIESMGIDFELV